MVGAGLVGDTAELIQLILVSAAGGVIYVLACAGLRLEELTRFWQYGRRRLNR